MRLEDEFLLACARVFAGTAEPESVRVSHEADRPYLLQTAGEHRITPCLNAFAQSAQLQESAYQRVRWSLLLTGELLKVIDLLEANGIDAIPFKGPVLSSILYGDAAARESCDIDLLVRPEDIHRTSEILVAAGYSTDLPDAPRLRAAYLRSRYELHFASPGNAIPIEIHQSFLSSSYCLHLDYEAMWRRAVRVPFFGRDVLSLSTTDLLLMLCVHGAKHLWAEVVHICDIARLLVTHGAEVRWPELLNQARESGATRILNVALLLASSVMNAPVPAAILDQAKADAIACQLSRQATSRLFAAGRKSTEFGDYIQFLRSRERVRDRLGSIARLMWSPNEEDYSLLHLPRFLSSLYVPLHAIRVAFKYGSAALRGGILNV